MTNKKRPTECQPFFMTLWQSERLERSVRFDVIAPASQFIDGVNVVRYLFELTEEAISVHVLALPIGIARIGINVRAVLG